VGEATSFTIEETTGTNNVIELIGRALPYRPFSLSGKMRAEKTWYPGNPIATLQMLGPDEDNTTVNGFWKDRFLMTQTDLGVPVIPEGAVNFNNVPLANVATMASQMDAMRLRGQLVKVTWGAQTRLGYIAHFKQDWINDNDMQWELGFEWVSQGDIVVPVLFAMPIPPGDIEQQLFSLLQALQQLVLAPFQLIDSVHAVIENALSDVELALASMRQTANKLSEEILSPLTAAQNTLASIQQIQDDAQSIADVVISFPARALISVSDIAEITQEQTFVAADYARQVRASARQMQSTAAELAFDLAGQTTNQTTIATFYAREDIDLRDVSNAYYDTPDEWHRIAAYNNFKGSRLSAGQTILVPQLGLAGETA
jgi:hypothetical protein